MAYKRLWIALCVVVVGSFAVLGGLGMKLLSNAPPIPERVVTSDGRVVFETGDGPYDPSKNLYSDSVIALAGKDLKLADYYTPANRAVGAHQ